MEEGTCMMGISCEELARNIIDALPLEEMNNSCSVSFVMYILGPPCVGKTLLQKAIFDLIDRSNICFISAGFFLKSRNIRLRNFIAECSSDAYDLISSRRIYEKILLDESVYVSKYDHETGKKSGFQILLTPKNIIYIEGIVWSYMLDICKPDLIVFLSPKDYEQWILTHQYRNEKYRNYQVNEAKIASILAYNSWIDLRNKLLAIEKPLAHKMIYANVDFYNNCPFYEVYSEFLWR